MKVINDPQELRTQLHSHRLAGHKIGLVPTMGFFHEGHLSLMDIAREKSDLVVTSLFVNPTQFGPGEDLERYPRNFDRDAKLAEERGTDILFFPPAELMYPQPFFTYVVTEKLAEVLCGATRKTHFRGVTTIVAKLFNLVQPDIAVFGQKDHQQAIIIRHMVADLNFPVEIIIAPITREKDGLAMSSRNTYLKPDERAQAPVIFHALTAAKQAVDNGTTSAAEIREFIRSKIKASPLAKIEYIRIVENRTLAEVAEINPGTFAAVAVFYGKTRLIDNIILKS